MYEQGGAEVGQIEVYTEVSDVTVTDTWNAPNSGKWAETIHYYLNAWAVRGGETRSGITVWSY